MKVTIVGEAYTSTRGYRIGNGKRRTYTTTFVQLDADERERLVAIGAIPTIRHAAVVIPAESNNAWPEVAAHANHRVRVHGDLRFRYPQSACPHILRPKVECADEAEHVMAVLAR